METKLLIKSFSLVFAVMLSACHKDDVSESELPKSDLFTIVDKTLHNSQGQIVEEENLPKWLSEFIENIAQDNINTVAAFKGCWKGDVVYYVYDSYSSCLLCSTFKSDGEKFDFNKIDPTEFLNSATDWKCIYLSKSKILDL